MQVRIGAGSNRLSLALMSIRCVRRSFGQAERFFNPLVASNSPQAPARWGLGQDRANPAAAHAWHQALRHK